MLTNNILDTGMPGVYTPPDQVKTLTGETIVVQPPVVEEAAAVVVPQDPVQAAIDKLNPATATIADLIKALQTPSGGEATI